MRARPVAISATPTIDPLNEASTSVRIVSFQPTNAPIIASIFGSPIPSASCFRSHSHT